MLQRHYAAAGAADSCDEVTSISDEGSLRKLWHDVRVTLWGSAKIVAHFDLEPRQVINFDETWLDLTRLTLRADDSGAMFVSNGQPTRFQAGYTFLLGLGMDGEGTLLPLQPIQAQGGACHPSIPGAYVLESKCRAQTTKVINY